MNLYNWAARWGVPPEALNDLRREFGAIDTNPAHITATTGEAVVQQRIRIEASQKGARLWRNNVGAVVDTRGNFIRYGICNDSGKINKEIKSSDLIGIKPVALPDGRIIGQFVAREVKPAGWHYTGTDREQAQLRFLELVAGLGGDAQFATSEGTI
jgi:hypothetical protein